MYYINIAHLNVVYVDSPYCQLFLLIFVHFQILV
jgi:hypothetical protein